ALLDPQGEAEEVRRKGLTMTIAFTPDRPLLLAGCGNMGAALLQGWIAAGIPAEAIRIIEPSGTDRAVAAGANAAQVFTEAPTDGVIPRAIVLAVKPQLIGSVTPALRPLIGQDTVV